MKFLLVVPSFLVAFAVAGWIVGSVAAEVLFPTGTLPDYLQTQVVEAYASRGIAIGLLLGLVAGIAFVNVLAKRDAETNRLERLERREELGYGEPNFDDFDDGIDDRIEEFEVISPIDVPPNEPFVPPSPPNGT